MLLRIRRLVEQRREAELAQAGRAVAVADAELAERRARWQDAGAHDGVTTPGRLDAYRRAGLAAGDDFEVARHLDAAARRDHAAALESRNGAAIERRSVERLHERRAADAARLATLHSDRRLSEAALQVWRNNR